MAFFLPENIVRLGYDTWNIYLLTPRSKSQGLSMESIHGREQSLESYRKTKVEQGQKPFFM